MSQPPVTSLPAALLDAMARGSVALFLGAGASRSASHPTAKKIPLGGELRDLLADRFFGGECKDRNLDDVASFVENEAGYGQLESYIAEVFREFSPGPGHQKIPLFRWQAIYELNYDLLVEAAYAAPSPAQPIAQFVRDQQNIDRELRALLDPVPLFKLHGSIDRLFDTHSRLVLSQEGYLRWNENRRRLFSRLEDSLAEYPVVFAGTALGDPHIRKLLDDAPSSRPMQYIVSPGLNQHDEALFSSRRVTPLRLSFDDFMDLADRSITPAARVLGAAAKVSSPIQRHFRNRSAVPAQLTAFLEDNVDFVYPEMPTQALKAEEFYRGQSQSWAPLEQGLDIPRTIYDSVMIRLIEAQHQKAMDVSISIMTGVSGSGKTVLSRRIAMDLALKYEHLVLYSPPRADIRPEPLLVLHEMTGKRLVLIVDQAGDQTASLRGLAEAFDKSGVPLTLLLVDTQAAFGTLATDLSKYVRSSHELRRLSEQETTALIAKLEEHACLGVLSTLTPEERLASFNAVADRQLLVALYEATQGRPLEDILVEEYNRIAFNEAQDFYLLICTLYQYRVTVRAGLVRRLTGVSFEQFASRLLQPLSEIVYAVKDPVSQDMAYRARHSQVAEIVFRRVLDTGSKRVAQFTRIIDEMDTSYSSDADAMRQLVNYRNLREVAPSLRDARQISQKAEQATGREPSILQQRALLEMNTAAGDLQIAREYLDAAQTARPYDRSLQHTRATLLTREAAAEGDPLIQKSLRGQARSILQKTRSDGADPYNASLKAQLALDELAELTSAPSDIARRGPEVLRLVDDAESAIREGRRFSPDFEQLTLQDVRLKRVLGGSDAAVQVLQRALDRNPQLEHVAAAYARAVRDKDPVDAAKRLGAALSGKPMSRALNQAMFDIMRASGNEFADTVWPVLRRSFTDEDGNLEYHIYAIRYAFMRNDRPLYEQMIDVASRLRGGAGLRERPRLVVDNLGSQDGRFSGRVVSMGVSFGFIQVQGLMDNIYCREDLSGTSEEWDKMRKGSKVTFHLRFNAKGPVATAIYSSDL